MFKAGTIDVNTQKSCQYEMRHDFSHIYIEQPISMCISLFLSIRSE